MPAAHANLSPSAAVRWISCPASIGMTARHAAGGGGDSAYAREGTLAHGLAELEAAQTFGLTTRRQYLAQKRTWQADFDKEAQAESYGEGTLEEMQEHVRGYIRYLAECLREYPNSSIALEQRLDTGVDECWGTTDAVIWSPTHIRIVDFKYGQGIRVYAARNPQLRLYGCGALDNYGDLIGITEYVYCTVYQPRKADYDVEQPDTERLTADELRAWREQVVIPAAAETRDPNARFGPSAEACHYCPVADICRVRMDAALAEDFGQDAEVISNDELGDILHRIPSIKAWCDAVERRALDQVYSQGAQVPGWKAVRSGGRRSIPEGQRAAALAKLQAKGFSLEDVATYKPKALGVLEKLTGKTKLPEILGDSLVKSAGSISIVPEQDKRTAISPASSAAEDFAVINDEE